MLYNIFIQPLVIILRAIYLGINYFAGNLGISLMILSVVMSILLRPFIKWAAGVQDKERKIQNILSPQIAEIKKTFHGAEQHEELSELYKRYSYNPIYAIRSGLDLFVQLLPLMAAYIMLSELEIIKGVSFYAIKDLSKPDNLLAGINLLPFVMTVFNVLAAITAKKFTKRERVQAFIIAALFLVMLYNAPSALLIYWTTNNFIMLVKNIDFYGIFGGDKIARVLDYRFVPAGWKKICVNAFIVIISMSVLGIFFAHFYSTFVDITHDALGSVINSINTFQNIYYLLFMIPAVFAWMLYTRFILSGFTIRELIAKTFCFAVFTIAIFFYMKNVQFPMKVFLRLSTFLLILFGYALLAFLLPVSSEKICSFSSRLTDDHRNSLFFSSIIFAIIFVCVLYPSLTYRSDPDFFMDSLAGTISKISIYGMTLLFALILIWPLIPEFVQNILAVIAAFLVCMAFINSFVLTENYGNINAIFIDERVMKVERAAIKDLLSISITTVIIFFCVWRKYIKNLVITFVLISIAMCGVSVYCYFNIRHDNNLINTENVNFPEYHNRLWRFSRTGKNVFAIFLDGFTGEHVKKFFAEYPEFISDFEGFIYFPDTLATGPRTFFSTPSIYAGPDYKPNTLNDTQPNVSIIEKYGNAISFLPNIFTSNGYDSVMSESTNNPIYLNALKHPESVLNLKYNWMNDYVPYWLNWANKNGIEIKIQNREDISQFLIVLSLFRSIPFSLRSKMYITGQWIWGASEQVSEMMLVKSFLANLAPLQFMGDFVQADDGKSTFKFLHSTLSHALWYMQPDSLLPVLDPYPQTKGQGILVDGIIPEHYYTEVHIMRFLADFLIKLKKAGVYDNTRIVFVSDHSWGDSQTINKIFDHTVYIDSFRPDALLMFKDFNSRGDLITSNALMSIEDTPALLIDGIAKAPGIYTIEELKKLSSSDRIRTYCENYPDSDNMNVNTFSIIKLWQVKGTMFKRENWTEIQ